GGRTRGARGAAIGGALDRHADQSRGDAQYFWRDVAVGDPQCALPQRPARVIRNETWSILMPFEQFKSSVEKYYKMATNSEPFSLIQKRASEAGDAIADTATSVSQSISDIISSRKPSSEEDATEGDSNVEPNYESLAALKPLRKLVSEAGVAINDKTRTLLDSDIPELLGAVGGVGAGAAAGAGILSVSAGSGLAGGAALASGLATAGGLVGGGMVAGIGVVAAPAIVLSAAGVWAVGRYN